MKKKPFKTLILSNAKDFDFSHASINDMSDSDGKHTVYYCQASGGYFNISRSLSAAKKHIRDYCGGKINQGKRMKWIPEVETKKSEVKNV